VIALDCPLHQVVDESHLLAAGSTASCLGSLMHVRAPRIWLVSGTPFSTTMSQLGNQADLLGMGPSLHAISRSWITNEALVDWLRQRMIRHTKNMRIGGEVALALPDADCRTRWLVMSEDERLLYGVHECTAGHGLSMQDHSRFRAASHLYDPLVVCGEAHDVKHGEGRTQGGSRERYTLHRPATTGSFAAAAAAFLRTHEAVRVNAKTGKRVVSVAQAAAAQAQAHALAQLAQAQAQAQAPAAQPATASTDVLGGGGGQASGKRPAAPIAPVKSAATERPRRQRSEPNEVGMPDLPNKKAAKQEGHEEGEQNDGGRGGGGGSGGGGGGGGGGGSGGGGGGSGGGGAKEGEGETRIEYFPLPSLTKFAALFEDLQVMAGH